MSTVAKFVRQTSQDDAAATDAFSGWSWIHEPVGISSDKAFTKPGLLEQINTTADQSDYLWYSLRYDSFQKNEALYNFYRGVDFQLFLDCFSIETKGDEPFLKDGSQTVLHVDSLGHALNVFINGKIAGV